MVVFDHVASHVKRQTQSLDRFQEFIIVLMKLKAYSIITGSCLQFLLYQFQPFQEYFSIGLW